MKCYDFDWQINEFMIYCRSTQLRDRTMYSYEQTLRLFERWCSDEHKTYCAYRFNSATRQIVIYCFVGLMSWPRRSAALTGEFVAQNRPRQYRRDGACSIRRRSRSGTRPDYPEIGETCKFLPCLLPLGCTKCRFAVVRSKPLSYGLVWTAPTQPTTQCTNRVGGVRKPPYDGQPAKQQFAELNW